MKQLPLLFILLLGIMDCNAQYRTEQGDTIALDKKKLGLVIGTEVVLYSSIMVGLNSLWYNDFERSPFHFFNDNDEWLQIDKVGHAVTGYYVGVLGMDALRWAGVDERKSRWYGGGLGWFFLTSFEVLDGTSAEWGFSNGDMISNTLGAGLAIGQDAAWREQRIAFKFSSHQTQYAALRPNVLGSNWRERIMKDYNGQTYWLSANINSFLKEESSVPKWLDLSVGYSVENMIDGRDAFRPLSEDVSFRLEGRREFFLSLDADLWRIETKKKWLKTVLKGLGFIKIPAPTFELSEGKGKFYWLYF